MTELVLLRQQFGISGTEYMTTLPWWEAELLLAAAGFEGGDGSADDAGGRRLSAFSEPPQLAI